MNMNHSTKRGWHGILVPVAGRLPAGIMGLLMMFGFLSNATVARCAETTFTEYQVKALFLFNFAKYVDWPDETFPATNTPITIGVLGQDNF